MVTRQILVWIEITIAFYSSAEMLKSATFFAWPQGAARPSTASGLVFLTTYTVGNCIHFYDILLGASQDRLALLQVVIAGILQLIAHAIWYWTRRTVKPKQLTVALARDVPATLISRGAYAYVRHPFYAAYMLCYGAASVLANSPRGYLVWLVIYTQYQAIARLEEDKFRKSALAREYSHYRSRTPRFFRGDY